MPVNLPEPTVIAPIRGVELRTFASGMRYQGRADLLLMQLAVGSHTAALFTRNKFSAAPVLIAKQHLGVENAVEAPANSATRALLINAGNANAGTGQQGLDHCLTSCAALAEQLSVKPEAVLPFSTGVIGVQLPIKEFRNSIRNLVNEPPCDWLAAARAIMTTDTVAKAASRTVQIEGQPVSVSGIAKGSGMICPDMATMLGFVATDAVVDQATLHDLLTRATQASFNRITVDGDTSTNDAITLSATGKAGHVPITDAHSAAAQILYQAIEAVFIELAQAIVRDGEGASKFVTVTVVGGQTQQDCAAVAYSIAHSPLVKTALNASDPNWGRLLMAIGKAPTDSLDIGVLDLRINDVALIEQGQPHPDYSEALGKQEFVKDEIVLTVNLNLGAAEYTVWTTDLSHDYIRINADYRS